MSELKYDMWDGDTYRNQCVDFIKKSGMDITGKENYQFGIFTGCTLVHIYKLFRLADLKVERIHALDSFDGLPDEKAGIPKHPVWQKREFCMKYIFKTENTAQIVSKIMSDIPDDTIPIEWHEGFYEDVLTEDWIKKHNVKSAFWVDIDVDLYISAIQVLDFMFKHKLIVPGTVISYDDWGGTEEFKGGESLAHKEACEKYGVECECFHTQKNGEHCQKAFVVRSING